MTLDLWIFLGIFKNWSRSTKRGVGCGIVIQRKGLGYSKGSNISLGRKKPSKDMARWACMGNTMFNIAKIHYMTCPWKVKTFWGILDL
jgi:hypothetical protein